MDEPLEARLHRLAAAKGLRVSIKRRFTFTGKSTRVRVFDATSDSRLATFHSLEQAERFLTGPFRAR
jgi:hypothetical protein